MFFESFNIVDLTHPLTPDIPTWNGSCGYCLEVKKDYDKVFRVQKMKIHAGVGTHMDAPSHRFEHGRSIGDIPIEELIAPVCLVNVSKKAHADYEISLEDINNYEKNHGMIAEGSLVIGYTGWDRFWLQPDKYRNLDSEGQMHFPAFSKKSAEFLLQRNVVGIAIDTLSPDRSATDFPVHRLILGAGKYIIENAANCLQLPPKGSFAIALPLRAEKSTESPIRMIGLIPK
jgi:kynurenine formamidase